MDAQGSVTMRAPAFTEGMYVVGSGGDPSGAVKPLPGDVVPLQGQEESVYGRWCRARATMWTSIAFPCGTGTFRRCGFGFDPEYRGGCVGADRVHSVAMPSRYTSQMSKDDAALQAKWLNVSTARFPSRACSRRLWPP